MILFLIGYLFFPFLTNAQCSCAGNNRIVYYYQQQQPVAYQTPVNYQPEWINYQQVNQSYPQFQQYQQYDPYQQQPSYFPNKGQRFRNTMSDISQAVNTLGQVVQFYQQIRGGGQDQYSRQQYQYISPFQSGY